MVRQSPVRVASVRAWSRLLRSDGFSCSFERKTPTVSPWAGVQAILLISLQSSRDAAGDTRQCILGADSWTGTGFVVRGGWSMVSSNQLITLGAFVSMLALSPQTFELHVQDSEHAAFGCGREETQGPSCNQ